MSGAMKRFEQTLVFGRLGEQFISQWLKRKGYGVIPSYAYSGKDGNKAPKLLFQREEFVVPDLDVCKLGKRFWLEIKTYGYAPENRNHGCLVHGIPGRLYGDYLDVGAKSGCPVHLGVLELCSRSFLTIALETARTILCTCPACRTNPRGCIGPMKQGVYFDRRSFRVQTVFDPSELNGIVSAWEKLNPGKDLALLAERQGRFHMRPSRTERRQRSLFGPDGYGGRSDALG